MSSVVRRYEVSASNEEAILKAKLSTKETLDLSERDLRCPFCGFLILKLFSDMHSGHLQAKCPKCKTISQYNTAYFRRKKRKLK